ncbi:MAG: hypothetical protein KME07_22170 [Pegethrix bostrychoides GSE-TBD4-15B]|uniref:SPOR domain-containing protein n=1 Tax=Pegethrix bostrychoides GSE-TBD4-15B TaxID=2839662 RepID=A0A951PED8_9CYAN|nr:hypothetical protein [Pegethrix bostrychoides GSE-TBD4-15B]
MTNFSGLRFLSGRELATTLACGSLLSAWIIPIQSAWARPLLSDSRHFLLAQQVTDGLPPPPAGYAQEAAQSQQYLVVVNGDSQILLSQVQAVQPTASVQEYNGQRFIQAGLYDDATSAQQQVNSLSAAGIGAQVVAVVNPASPTVSQSLPYDVNSPGTLPPAESLPTTVVPSTPTSVEFNSAPPASSAEVDSDGRAYFVVIPSNGKKLDAISEQVTRLTDGMGVDGMIATATKRGSHVQVGPFNSRSAANRWTRYFRDFGMDARVSYGS